MTDAFPIRRIEEIFTGLKNAKYFAKVDLQLAYWQISLDKEAQDLSTINTSLGLFRVLRLQMGMKNSAAIFQKAMETILNGLPGILCYQDDILVYAETQASLKKRLNALHNRLQEKNVTVNFEKCVELNSKVTF